MLNYKIPVLSLLSLTFLLFGCNMINPPPLTDECYAIYFLKNDDLTISDVLNTNIDSLKLKSTPWLTSEDIEYYDWSSHCIYLKKDKVDLIPGWEEMQPLKHMFPKEWADMPFVVTSEGQRKYLGSFFNSLYSLELVLAPEFVDLGFNANCPSNVLMYYWPFLYVNNTLDNLDIKQSLIDNNLLHEGITIELDSTNTNTIIVLDNSDTATISYTITITNNDENDLFIMDPDITGSEIFHYYNNGPDFFNIDTKKEYKSWYKEIAQLPTINYWSPEWFIKLSSMESIKRTIVLKGYSKFSNGSYLVECRYNSPLKMSNDDVFDSDKRYWYGITRSDYFVWNY